MNFINYKFIFNIQQIDRRNPGIIIIRKCIPFDFGPSSRCNDELNRFHFWDLDSPDGSHNLSIHPEQLLEIKILDERFDPKDYVTWKPTNWVVKRDWGAFS